MKKFMDKDFLLTTPAAKTLFHDYAAKQPIIDYHSEAMRNSVNLR